MSRCKPPDGSGTEHWHGTANGYDNHICRCDRCRTAHAAAIKARRRQRMKERLPIPGTNPVRYITTANVTHGKPSTYTNYRCQCDPCLRAHADYVAERKRIRTERQRQRNGKEDATMSDRLIYLDVDGPLNPYAAPSHRRPDGYTTHRMSPPSWIAQQEPVQVMRGRVKPLRVVLHPDAGAQLLQLADDIGAQLVWATTWEHDANDYIGPHIGLPKLEVVEFGDARKQYREGGQHWKLDTLIDHAAGRSFVWLDDEVTQRDLDYLERRYVSRGFSALAMFVSPRIGLVADDFDVVRDWARSCDTANGDVMDDGDAA